MPLFHVTIQAGDNSMVVGMEAKDAKAAEREALAYAERYDRDQRTISGMGVDGPPLRDWRVAAVVKEEALT